MTDAALAARMRELADFLDTGEMTATEIIVIGRLPDGEILAHESDMDCGQAVRLAGDYAEDLQRKVECYVRERQPCGVRAGRGGRGLRSESGAA